MLLLMPLSSGLLFPWLREHGEGRRGLFLQLPALGMSMSWAEASLLPSSVVGRVGISHREHPDISSWGSRALGQFVPVLLLRLDGGKLLWMPLGSVAEVTQQHRQGGFQPECWLCCCVKSTEQHNINLRR